MYMYVCTCICYCLQGCRSSSTTPLQNPDELKYDFLHGMPSPFSFLIENKIFTAVSYCIPRCIHVMIYNVVYRHAGGLLGSEVLFGYNLVLIFINPRTRMRESMI